MLHRCPRSCLLWLKLGCQKLAGQIGSGIEKWAINPPLSYASQNVNCLEIAF